MGRKKLDKTEQEIEEQKQRWWGPKHNEKRKEKYASDEEYRERVLKVSRKNYRRTKGKTEQRDCEENLLRLPEIGKVRPIYTTQDKLLELLSFTSKELGEALGGYTLVNIYRWHAKGLVPKPIYSCSNLRDGLYLRDEVLAIIPPLAAIQREKDYFSTRDTKTINEINRAVEAVRERYLIGGIRSSSE